MVEFEGANEFIRKEVDLAHDYARRAVEIKEKNQALAECYYKNSNDHLNSAMAVHNVIVGIINDYKKLNGDVPSDMKRLYNILHKENIEHTAAVKGMLALYKGG